MSGRPKLTPVRPSSATDFSWAAPPSKPLQSPPAARLALICDYLEEGWLSMDLTAQMVFDHLQSEAGPHLRVGRIRPGMRRLFSALPASPRFALNADRVVARFLDYPRALRRQRARFDLFHIVDHSYAHLACELPGDRTVITCHDVDAFRCLARPGSGVRQFVMRAMAQRSLQGLRRAARVLCVSAATRDELIAARLVEPERTAIIHNGVHPACSPFPDPDADAEAARLCGAGPDSIPVLHVGSTVARKRIEFLLKVIAEVRKQRPNVILLRVGGPLTGPQKAIAACLGLEPCITTLPRLSPRVLSAVYRRAVLVLQPSEREGFGLPVAEALACGTPIIASGLPSLQEVGGGAAVYCPVGDLTAWCGEVVRLIDEYRSHQGHLPERRLPGLAQAAKFSWTAHARQLMAIYRDLL
jgi:glycosyltransferase involved in cell wall biosynthesis